MLNGPLVKALEKYKEMDKSKRDFTQIASYFKSQGIEMLLHKDKRHDYFSHRGDGEYFRNIPRDHLRAPLIFIDPDNGLQVKESTKQHLLFHEAKYVYEHMDKDSILMIYQHFPLARSKHREYLPQGRAISLEKELGISPIYVSDDEIVFFLLARNNRLRSQLRKIAIGYRKDYPDHLHVGNS